MTLSEKINSVSKVLDDNFVKILRIVDTAPHAASCDFIKSTFTHNSKSEAECNCWKSKVLEELNK